MVFPPTRVTAVNALAGGRMGGARVGEACMTKQAKHETDRDTVHSPGPDELKPQVVTVGWDRTGTAVTPSAGMSMVASTHQVSATWDVVAVKTP